MKAVDLANKILKAASEGKIDKNTEVWFEYCYDIEEVESAYVDEEGDIVLTAKNEEDLKNVANI